MDSLFEKNYFFFIIINVNPPNNAITTNIIAHNQILFLKSGSTVLSWFLGIICFLVFLLVLYAQVYSKTGKLKLRIINNLLSGIAVYYMFTTLIVSGIYNPRDIGGILLGGLLSLKYYYKAQHQKNEYNLEC